MLSLVDEMKINYMIVIRIKAVISNVCDRFIFVTTSGKENLPSGIWKNYEVVENNINIIHSVIVCTYLFIRYMTNGY